MDVKHVCTPSCSSCFQKECVTSCLDINMMFQSWESVGLCSRPSDQASLLAASCVEKMQELILDLLSRMCGAQAGAARGGPQRFGRLLGRLTELRTLRHNYLLLTRQQMGHWHRSTTVAFVHFDSVTTRYIVQTPCCRVEHLGNARFSPVTVQTVLGWKPSISSVSFTSAVFPTF